MRLDLRWLALLLFGLSGGVHAGPPAPACLDTMLGLAPWVEVLEDTSRTFDAATVLQLPADEFQSATATTLAPGISNAIWWLRITLRNDTAQACQRWLLVGPARMRNVRIYLQQGGQMVQMRHGPAYPLQEWALPLRRPMFPIQLAPGETVDVAIRVPGLHQQVAFTPQLWEPNTFRDSAVRYDLLDGAVFGAMLLLVLAAIALSWVFRRWPLLHLALGVLCFTGYVGVASNYGMLLIWPQLPRFDSWARLLLVSLTFWMAYKYLCHVVRVHRLEPFWNYFFVAVRAGFLVLGLFGTFMDPAFAKGSLLLLSNVGRAMLTLALLVGLWRGVVRSWFPPVLITLLWVQMILRYTDLLGKGGVFAPDSEMFATTVLPGGILLLLVTLLQIRKAQRRAISAKIALDEQRQTERRRLEQQVLLRTEELQRALEARSSLLARISHDLRSPLIGIVDATRQWRVGATRHDYPHIIEQSARQQMALIDELLEFSRDEMAGLELLEAPGYLHRFLHDVAEQAQLLAERNDSQLECRFAEDLPAFVCADFRRLRQVLINLLGNAAKFTHGGRIVFAVRGLGVAQGGKLRLQWVVEDSGIGIAEDERDHLMLPFRRGRNAAQHAGSGLGLAIVNQLLHLMNTRLVIEESTLGGTRFGFELTLALADESDLEPDFAGLPGADVDGAGRTILLVDDQLQNGELLSDLLEGSGFNTLFATDGLGALALLDKHPVDLLLTDQSMPGMDGWGLLEAVRARGLALPVVLYSARPPSRPPELDPSLDFTAALLKPAASGELLQRLVEILPPVSADAPCQA